MKFSLIAAASAALVLGSAAAAPLSQKRGPGGYGAVVDDGDSSVTYGGDGWQHVTGQDTAKWNDGTYSYSGSADAYFSAPLIGGAASFSIWGATKDDRGLADVFLNGAYIGTFDAYGSSASGNDGAQELFSYGNTGDSASTPIVTSASTITVVNTGYDPRVGASPYLFWDRIEENSSA